MQRRSQTALTSSQSQLVSSDPSSSGSDPSGQSSHSHGSSLATQPPKNSPEDEAADQTTSGRPKPWGYLYPEDDAFRRVELVKDEYVFGRGEGVDYRFMPDDRALQKFCVESISQRHFIIRRSVDENDSHELDLASIVDISKFGTFVNEEKLESKKTRILSNNDTIAMVRSKKSAFMFVSAADPPYYNDFPREFRAKYVPAKEVGNGSSGVVRLAYERQGPRKVAVKIQKWVTILEDRMKANDKAILTEIDLLKQLQHPCIVQYIEFFSDKESVFIVMEYARGGNLRKRIDSMGRGCGERFTKLYMVQLVCAVAYLHSRNIIHRDIKPENVLLDRESDEAILKLVDFGFSKKTSNERQSTANAQCNSIKGTVRYLAPEIILTAKRHQTHYTNAVDYWGLGCIMFVCLVGFQPFCRAVDEQFEVTLRRIFTDIDLTTKEWRSISSEAKNVVKHLLHINPGRRYNHSSLMADPWISADHELLSAVRRLVPGLLESYSSMDLNSPDVKIFTECPFASRRPPTAHGEKPSVRRERSPIRRERSPVRRERSPVRRERSLVRRERTPVRRCRSPIHQDSPGSRRGHSRTVGRR